MQQTLQIRPETLFIETTATHDGDITQVYCLTSEKGRNIKQLLCTASSPETAEEIIKYVGKQDPDLVSYRARIERRMKELVRESNDIQDKMRDMKSSPMASGLDDPQFVGSEMAMNFKQQANDLEKQFHQVEARRQELALLL